MKKKMMHGAHKLNLKNAQKNPMMKHPKSQKKPVNTRKINMSFFM